MPDLSVGIVGGSGYGGGELLRLLLTHPRVGRIQASSQRFRGRRVGTVHPNLRSFRSVKFCAMEDLQPCDLLFVALPHGQTVVHFDSLEGLAPRMIDLGGDFRLDDPERYAFHHGEAAPRPDLLREFVYGIPELHRDRMREARFVSSAGCNATATILALHPLYRAGLVDPDRTVVEVKAGTSQGGNAPAPGSHHPERSGSIRCYKPVGHRHAAEIRQELRQTPAAPFHFSATALDMVRGVQAVAHVFLADPQVTETEIRGVYHRHYGQEPFVRVLNERQGPHRMPDPRHLAGTNYCDLGLVRDPESDRLVIVAALDNLGKGAAGQAVQAANIMLGWDETTGLGFPGLYPV
jgi:N-acetyl-gamma-glutamyl-phosphate/LysW-gamma-L-alpha-aminoadipyl-6-phosphate reductase